MARIAAAVDDLARRDRDGLEQRVELHLEEGVEPVAEEGDAPNRLLQRVLYHLKSERRCQPV